MASKAIAGLKADLKGMGKQFSRLKSRAKKSQADAGKKLRGAGDRIGATVRNTKQRVGKVAEAGANEARATAQSLRAGWTEVGKTHAKLSRAAKKKTASASRTKRG